MNESAPAVVSAAWLKENRAAALLAVVDATYHLPVLGRDARAEYREAHIPGTVYFDIDDIADPEPWGPLDHMLPDAETFAAKVGALGISRASHVIAYDTRGLYSAARVWWMFRVFGHDRVSVLDVGLPAWRAAGGETERGDAAPEPRAYEARPPRRESVCSWRGVHASLRDPNLQIVDARNAARFSGRETDPYPQIRSGGHMPGAVSLPWEKLLTDGVWMPDAEETRARFEAAGADWSRPVIASCGSGVTACILALAMDRAGKRDWTVYDGSWAEWAARPDTPVEKLSIGKP